MKAILMSIHPKWCEKIFNGEKTIEVRKTAPKLKTPFKVYVYCTKGKPYLYKNPNSGELFLDNNDGYRGGDYEDRYLTGKVIGSFVCDRITNIHCYSDTKDTSIYEPSTCLTGEEICEYLNYEDGYGWHISDLKIYDKPKELYDFRPWCEKSRKNDDNLEMCCNCKNAFFDDDGVFFDCGLTRPPMSWCYVEEER